MAIKKVNFGAGKANQDYLKLYLGLQSRNMLGGADNSRIIGFISRTGGEGVSTTVSGLAMSLNSAFPGSVLVVDANPVTTGSKRIADIVEVNSRLLTTAAIQSGTPDIAEFIAGFGTTAVGLLTLDSDAAGQEIVATELCRVISDLKKEYATILVDIGAWDQVIPTAWTALLDHLVLVVDGNKTTRELLENFKKTLEFSEHRLSGFILNRQQRPIPEFLYRRL